MRKVITCQPASLPLRQRHTHTNMQISLSSHGQHWLLGRRGKGLLDRNKHEAGFSETALWATQNYRPEVVFKILMILQIGF